MILINTDLVSMILGLVASKSPFDLDYNWQTELYTLGVKSDDGSTIIDYFYCRNGEVSRREK